MKEELNDSKELKEFSANLKELNEEEMAQVNGGKKFEFKRDPKNTPCATVVPPEGGC